MLLKSLRDRSSGWLCRRLDDRRIQICGLECVCFNWGHHCRHRQSWPQLKHASVFVRVFSDFNQKVRCSSRSDCYPHACAHSLDKQLLKDPQRGSYGASDVSHRPPAYTRRSLRASANLDVDDQHRTTGSRRPDVIAGGTLASSCHQAVG